MARTKRQNRRLGIKTRRIRYSSRTNSKIRSQRKNQKKRSYRKKNNTRKRGGRRTKKMVGGRKNDPITFVFTVTEDTTTTPDHTFNLDGIFIVSRELKDPEAEIKDPTFTCREVNRIDQDEELKLKVSVDCRRRLNAGAKHILYTDSKATSNTIKRIIDPIDPSEPRKVFLYNGVGMKILQQLNNTSFELEKVTNTKSGVMDIVGKNPGNVTFIREQINKMLGEISESSIKRDEEKGECQPDEGTEKKTMKTTMIPFTAPVLSAAPAPPVPPDPDPDPDPDQGTVLPPIYRVDQNAGIFETEGVQSRAPGQTPAPPVPPPRLLPGDIQSLDDLFGHDQIQAIIQDIIERKTSIEEAHARLVKHPAIKAFDVDPEAAGQPFASRYGNILPSEKHRILLEPPVENEKKLRAYYNASSISTSSEEVGDAIASPQYIAANCNLQKENANAEASMMALINQTNPRFVLMVTGIIENGRPKCTDYFYKEGKDVNGKAIPEDRFRFYRLSNDFEGEAVGFEGQKVIKEGSIIEYGGKYERTDDYFVGVDIFNEAKIVPGFEGSVEPFSFGEPSSWVGGEPPFIEVADERERDLEERGKKQYPLEKREIETRQITHFHYRSWPDHGVPTHGADESLKYIVKKSAEYLDTPRKEKKRPILVHCSAGVGRTGVIIMMIELTRLVENFYNKGKPIIKGTTGLHKHLNGLDLTNKEHRKQIVIRLLIYLRFFRTELVQTPAQLSFVLAYLEELTTKKPAVPTPEQLNNADSQREQVQRTESMEPGISADGEEKKREKIRQASVKPKKATTYPNKAIIDRELSKHTTAFKGKMTRAQAETSLKEQSAGTYILRQGGGGLVISVKIDDPQNPVRHSQITIDGSGQFTIGTRGNLSADTLEGLIENCRTTGLLYKDGKTVQLTSPLP